MPRNAKPTHTRVLKTALGVIRLVTSEAGIVALSLASAGVPLLPAVFADAKTCASGTDRCTRTERELVAYANGERVHFSVPVDLSAVRGFARAALEAVREIPYGGVASYGEVAELAGSPRASRAVGSACKRTPISILVPVHRVIRSDGSIGGFGDDVDLKRRLLELEGADLRSVTRSTPANFVVGGTAG